MRLLIALAVAGAALGQQLDLSRLDGLSAKAKQVANVDLDSEKLKLASGLIASDDNAKNVISQMKGVFVRNFTFEAPGAYTQADLDPVRAQLTGPAWNRIVHVKGTDETVEVWFHSDAGKLGGMTVLAGKPKELTVVNIVGPLDLASLAKLGGSFGLQGALKPLEGSKKPATEPGKPK
jgi:hypothetical protein